MIEAKARQRMLPVGQATPATMAEFLAAQRPHTVNPVKRERTHYHLLATFPEGANVRQDEYLVVLAPSLASAIEHASNTSITFGREPGRIYRPSLVEPLPVDSARRQLTVAQAVPGYSRRARQLRSWITRMELGVVT